MMIKTRAISTKTLLAAAIACIVQAAIFPLTLLLFYIAAPLAEQINKEFFLNFSNTIFSRILLDLPIVIVGSVALLVLAGLFYLASKQIHKKRRITLWSILTLISSLLLLQYGPSHITMIASWLGIVGSVSGLIYTETKKI